MRRIRSAAIAAALATIGLIPVLRAQSTPGTTAPAGGAPAPTSAPARPARYLLRHGLDYLAYPQEAEKALAFLREAQARQTELSEAERQELRLGLEQARQAVRATGPADVPAPGPGDRVALRPSGAAAGAAAAIPPPRMPDPGAIAPAPIAGRRAPAPEPIRRTSGTRVEPAEVRPFPAAASPGLAPPAPSGPDDLPPLPDAPPALPAPPPPPPALSEQPLEPAPRAEEPAEPATPPDLPPVAPPPLPSLPEVPVTEVAPPPAPAAEELTPPPSAAATPLAEASAPTVTDLQPAARPPSSLSSDLQREVQQMAERQDLELQQYGPAGAPRSPIDEPEPPTSRLELPRAPSPTESRQIVSIPVIPEDFVPMAPRTWSPSRKFWAAAATCHAPLYFQDAALERYGQSAEQALGPAGRCLSYPLDDRTQSDQRNQILQPFFSVGKFASQIVLLPYHLVVDPPCEAEYDLGYYRPGDRIPTDTHYLPVWGVGPPLRGRHY